MARRKGGPGTDLAVYFSQHPAILNESVALAATVALAVGRAAWRSKGFLRFGLFGVVAAAALTAAFLWLERKPGVLPRRRARGPRVKVAIVPSR